MKTIGKSCMYIINTTGHNIDPCVTPAATVNPFVVIFNKLGSLAMEMQLIFNIK